MHSISIENQEFLPPSAEASWRKDSFIKNHALQFWISYNKAIQDTTRSRTQRELKKIIKEQGISILLISPMTPSMREVKENQIIDDAIKTNPSTTHYFKSKVGDSPSELAIEAYRQGVSVEQWLMKQMLRRASLSPVKRKLPGEAAPSDEVYDKDYDVHWGKRD